MKIRKDVDLSRYGFYVCENDEEYNIYTRWVYKIGHSRRGQLYYYFVDDERNLKIYASEPDGSGGSVVMDDIILRMYEDDCFE